MTFDHWRTFVELLSEPFRHPAAIWGIVPLYFGWLVNETTASKASYRTALQTGFSFLWAGAQWIYPHFAGRSGADARSLVNTLPAISLVVTLLVLTFGAIALISGLRHKFPRHLSFLGHTRFSNYFMITIFPIQAHYLGWTWQRLGAIVLFAIPIWLTLHFGLMPIRNRK